MYTIIIILAFFLFIAIFYDWLYKSISWRELKKLCGSIHPHDYIVLLTKKNSLKDYIMQETKKEYLEFIELMKKTGRKLRNK